MNSSSPRPLGKGMLIIAWVCGLLVASTWFNQILDKRNNPNQQPASQILAGGAKEVVLKRNSANQYLSRGYINGKAVTFLLDTGATEVSIPAHLQQELGLHSGASAYAYTANGRVQIFSTRINQLRLGEIQLSDVAGHLNPGLTDDTILLGMTALADLELRQSGQTLTLTQTP